MSPTSSSLESKHTEWQTSVRARVRALLAKRQSRLEELDAQLLERTQAVVLQLQQQVVEELELQAQHDSSSRQESLLEQVLQHVQNLQSDLQLPREPIVDPAVKDAEQIEREHEFDALRNELDLRQAELQRLADALDHRERETELQRKNISKQLWARKAELLAEVERLRSEVLLKNSGNESQSQVRLAEELARTERLQSEVRRVEQQCDDARKLITDLRADLERERNLAREQEKHRRIVEEERVALTAEVERLRVVCETAVRDKSQLEEQLQSSRAETERQVNELRSDHGRAFDERFHQLFSQIDSLTAERQRLQDERTSLQEAVRRLEESTQRLQQEQSRLEDEVLSVSEERDRLREEFEQAQAQWSEERLQLQDAPPPVDEAAQERVQFLQDRLTELQLENEQLERLCKEAREARAATADEEASDSDLQQRLDLALEEIRELKGNIQDLKKKNAQAESSAIVGGGYNWEEQKRRLLEQLESDFDENDEKQRADKLTVAGAIRITDQVVADKDREIEELQRLLENQSENIGNVAVGAAAFGAILDQDELIVQERENLKSLKEEMQEKLRKAEIEISLERAKLSRERTELEDKLRSYDADLKRSGTTENSSNENVRKSSSRGAWLTRLGLRDQEK